MNSKPAHIKAVKAALWYFNRITGDWLTPDINFLFNFRRAHGYWPALRRPRSFSERVLWLMRNDRNGLRRAFADKVTVRSYVAEKAPGLRLPQVYAVCERAEDIPFVTLPYRFVVICAHGSGFVEIVRDKVSIDQSALMNLCRSWLSHDFYYDCLEWCYWRLQPRLIVEELLSDGINEVPPDYKIFVSEGKARLIQVDMGRFNNHRRNMYTPDWELLPFDYKRTRGEQLARPRHLARMVQHAEQLGQDVSFVRVDLYVIGDDIYFGELTNFPGGGLDRFHQTEWDYGIGELMGDFTGTDAADEATDAAPP